MFDDLTLFQGEAVEPEKLQPLYLGISQDWRQKGLPPVDQRPMTFLLHDREEQVVGGFYATTYWEWMEIIALWVSPDLRGKGYARELVCLAEKEADSRGCHGAFVDTFSFQARGFYEKLGYSVFGTLPRFPAGHERFYLNKTW